MSATLKVELNSSFAELNERMTVALVMVLVTSIVIIPGMTTYLPYYVSDNSILLFPFVWSGLFIYCFLGSSIRQVWGVLAALTAIHSLCIGSILFP